jgi:hypothetical protein
MDRKVPLGGTLAFRAKVDEREHSDYDADIENWKAEKPHGISALMRLRNDTEFVEWTIRSHQEWIDEWVIVTQPSDDNTEEKAAQMAEIFDNVRVLHYPFVVEWLTPTVGEMSDTSIYSPAQMTNWGLSQCTYSWIAKIEGDVVALPTFQHIRDLVDMRPDDPRYYGRVGLNVAGSRYNKISKTNPRNAGWDEAVFPALPKYHCIGTGIWESMNMQDYHNQKQNMGWSFMHMKRSKYGKAPGSEEWIEFTRANVEEALRIYGNNRGGYPGPAEPTTDVLYDWRDRYAK